MDRPGDNRSHFAQIGLIETQDRVQQLQRKLRLLEAQPEKKVRSYASRERRERVGSSFEEEAEHAGWHTPEVLPDGSHWYGGVLPTVPRQRSDRATNREKAWEWSNRKNLPPPRQLLQTLPPKFQKYQDAVRAKLREKIDNQNEESSLRRKDLLEDIEQISKLPDEVVSKSVKKWMVKARKNLSVRRNQLDMHSKMTNEWAIPTLLAEVKRDRGKEDADGDRLLGNRDVSAQRLSFAPRP
jgi:hypothetical protein